MGIIKEIKGATCELDYLIHFDEYADNVSMIDGIIKPHIKTLELYGGKIISDSIKESVKLYYEVKVFDTLQDKRDYENQKLIING